MFVFSKARPKSINLICDKVNVTAGKRNSGVNGRSRNGLKRYKEVTTTQKIGRRENVWVIPAGNNTKDDKTEHPAPFPEPLAGDPLQYAASPHDCFVM